MTDFEKAVSIIDRLLVLFCLRDGNMDFGTVQEGMNLIEKARQQNPNFLVTMSLVRYLEDRQNCRKVV